MTARRITEVEYAPCGECPKDKCDGCDFCLYFVAYQEWLDAGAEGYGPTLGSSTREPTHADLAR